MTEGDKCSFSYADEEFSGLRIDSIKVLRFPFRVSRSAFSLPENKNQISELDFCWQVKGIQLLDCERWVHCCYPFAFRNPWNLIFHLFKTADKEISKFSLLTCFGTTSRTNPDLIWNIRLPSRDNSTTLARNYDVKFDSLSSLFLPINGLLSA